MEAARAFVLLRRMNWWLVIATVLVATIGVLFVHSAYLAYGEQAADRYQRQLRWMLIGGVLFTGIALADYHRICKDAWWMYGMGIMLLILVLLWGTVVHGGRRWLHLFGVGFQPSELAKFGTVIALARFMSRPYADLRRVRYVAMALGIAAIPSVLIFLQPDLGTAAVLLPIVFVMLFAAGAGSRVLAALVLAGVLAVAVALSAMFLPEKLGCSEERQEQVLRTIGLKPYHKDRVETFLAPGKDPLNTGWNKMQSEIAIGSGGLTGRGYRKGISNILGFLPRSVAPTDFIFSVVAEEEGFVGGGAVLLLYGAIVLCGMRAAAAATDKLGRLLCVGMTTLVFVHAFTNVAMTIGLLPVTGLPLPLMSSGGTFAVCTLAALGIVQSVYIRRRFVRY